jgi:hypothetical protein
MSVPSLEMKSPRGGGLRVVITPNYDKRLNA